MAPLDKGEKKTTSCGPNEIRQIFYKLFRYFTETLFKNKQKFELFF